MSTTFNIHPDFQAIKGRKLSLKPWAVSLMGNLLATVNALHRRKFKTIVSRQTIASLDGYAVPVLHIRPENLSSPAAALLYYHGGAFIMKHAPQHLENAVRYAREGNCCVMFVDYRLAPKHPFPAGFHDCYAALRWVWSNADELGVDKRRIAVGGDSAGGALAAAAAQKALHEDGIKLGGQLLIYPVTDARGKSFSSSAYANVPPFKDASPSALWAAYLGHPVSAGVPRYASPIDGDLASLAPAYVEIGEFDMLHDEGYAYAQALTAQGVEVELNETKGTVHGFDLLAANSDISKAAMARRIEFLKKVFST
jgi:acetyl esterase